MQSSIVLQLSCPFGPLGAASIVCLADFSIYVVSVLAGLPVRDKRCSAPSLAKDDLAASSRSSPRSGSLFLAAVSCSALWLVGCCVSSQVTFWEGCWACAVTGVGFVRSLPSPVSLCLPPCLPAIYVSSL